MAFAEFTGLSVSATPSSTTSISISWELESSLTATSYTISYSNSISHCFLDSKSGIPASGTSHTLASLQEGTQYTIAVTATLSGGGTLERSAVAATLTAGSLFLLYFIVIHTLSLSQLLLPLLLV